jgi:hypothetical protein
MYVCMYVCMYICMYERGLAEPSPQAHPTEGIYIARTLVQDHPEVSARVLNATHDDKELARWFLLAHCEPDVGDSV